VDTDARRLEVVDHRLPEVRVGDIAVVISRVEALRVARLGQELPRLPEVVRRDGSRPVEVEGVRDDAPRDPRQTERLRLVDRLPVDRVARGEPYPTVRPRRLGVEPLLRED